MIARLARTGLTALLVLAAAFPSGATTVIGKDLDDLCREADRIFVGKVVASESRWRDPSAQSVETVVTFAVLEPILGDLGAEVSLTFPGGEVDGLRHVVGGMPVFALGEEVLLFARSGPYVSPLVGFHQGGLRITNGEGGRLVARPARADTARALRVDPHDDRDGDVLPLDELLDDVRHRLSFTGSSSEAQ